MSIIFPGPGEDNFGADSVDGSADADTLDGGALNDTLNGRGGNDRVLGRFGDDLVFGGDGDDFISGGEDGNDRVEGGDGNDTIFESNNSDRLFGGDGDDSIVARGNSTTDAGNGNDTVAASSLAVAQNGLLGGGGTDLLILGPVLLFEADFNAAAAGFEFIQADNGVNGGNAANAISFAGVGLVGTRGLFVNSGAGNDTLTGLDLGKPGDILVGSGGNDIVNGLRGNDQLFGEAGNDELNGGAGNDTLTGAAISDIQDRDTLSGGTGNDVIKVTGTSVVQGGAGNDRIFIGNAVVTDASLFADDPAQPPGRRDILIVEGDAVFAVTEFDFADNGFEFLAPSKSIFGDGGDNILEFSKARLTSDAGTFVPHFFGQDGNDIVRGTLADDEIHGESDNDRLFGGLGNDLIFGGFHDDTLGGGAGNDTLLGDSGDNLIEGNAGEDSIVGMANSTIDGGLGDDWVRMTGATITEQNVKGGSEVDTIEIDNTCVVKRFFGETFERIATSTLIGDGLGNVIDLSSLANVAGAKILISGQGGNDRLFGTRGPSRGDGGAGNDFLFFAGSGSTMNGGEGNDTGRGGAGGLYTFNGDTGIDLIIFNWILPPAPRLDAEAAEPRGIRLDLSRTDTQNTGFGRYTLSGVENALGSRLADTISGSNAANVLTGLAGGDVLDGRLGDDTINGGAGIDTASFASAAAGVTVSLRLRAAQDTGQGLDKITGVENLTGSSQADRLTGSLRDNVLTGGGGADTLTGAGGNDVFDYNAVGQSRPGAGERDVIRDFVAHGGNAANADTVDLSDIDARPGGADNAFAFIGTADFFARGQVRFEQNGARTIVEINTGGGLDADMRLDFAGTIAFTEADFVL